MGGDWRIGVLAGYSRSSGDVGARASTADIDSYHLGLYGGTQRDGLAVRGGVAYSWHDIDTNRVVDFTGFADSLAAGYGARTLQGFGELGYRFETDLARFEPFVNLAHVSVDTDGFDEAGGAGSLSSSGGTSDTTFTTFGIRAETDLDLGAIEGRLTGALGWRHTFGDVAPTSMHAFAGSDTFTIAGSPIARDALVLQAGLALDLSAEATLNFTYQGQIANSAQDHGFKANLGVDF